MKRCEGIDLDPPAPLDLGDPAALLLRICMPASGHSETEVPLCVPQYLAG
jgi:hypothetical protein